MDKEEANEKHQSGFQIAKEAYKQTQERINQSWFGRTVDWIGDNFGAFFRQGSKEIAQILPAFPDGVRPVEELGTMGNPTQWEVNQERGNVHGKEQSVSRATFERDPGYEAWLDQQAAERKPPSNERGVSM